MDKLDEMFFQALSLDRAESANTLEKPSMRGIKNSVVEKYSDQAHFIYELLQNADDAKATHARFILEQNKLIFAHNGSRHFSVTNPANEEIDTEEGTLGDINAITSIANSNKTQASIGKFGVGFKAVFQYTSTPHIYDPKFHFKIERFIVPKLVHQDFPKRLPEETLFVFPFDHPDRDEDEAYKDISEKLQNLSFPLLFLSHVKEIEFEFGGVLGLYGKTIKESRKFGDTVAERICLTQNNGDDFYDENLWLFSRTYDDHTYSVGFFLDDDGFLQPVNEPAFCFFPTKEATGLKFMIHAPFLLTDSREGIRAGIEHNNVMLQLLADLSADSLLYLRDIGEEKGIRLIDDRIVKIIPVDPDEFSDPNDRRRVSFLPFYESIRERFERCALLPSTEGYAFPYDAYWAEFPQLPQLISNEQLSEIVPHENAKWIFPSLSRYDTNRYDKPLCTYIESLCQSVINEDAVISGRRRDFAIVRGQRQSLENIRGINPEFIEKQSIEWLNQLYKWIFETKHRTEISANKPIFLDQNRKATAAFDNNNQAILFLPVNGVSGYRVVHPDLLANSDTRAFVEEIGVKEPSLRDQIYNIILPMYRDGESIDTDPHFLMFFKYFCECPHTEVNDFVDLIKDYEFLTYYDYEDPQAYRGAASSMYLPTPELKSYFVTKPDTRFVALDEYKDLVGTTQEKQLIDFLRQLGVKEVISTEEMVIDGFTSDREDLPFPSNYTHKRGISWSETNLDGCKELLDLIVSNRDAEKSYLLWNCLLKVIETHCTSWRYQTLGTLLRGVCKYFYYHEQRDYFPSSDAIALKEKPWIVRADGEFATPEDILLEDLSPQYETESDSAQALLSFLEITSENEAEEDEDDYYLTDSQKKAVDFYKKLLKAGLDSDEELEEYLEYRRQKKAKDQEELLNEQEHTSHANPEENQVDGNKTNEDDDLSFLSELGESEEGTDAKSEELATATTRVVKDIFQIAKNKHPSHISQETLPDEEPDIDQDEYNPVSIDYSDRIKKAKKKSAVEIEKIAYYEQLQARAKGSPKYSYGWFNALLEMESINSGENVANRKEVSISFAKVEREPGTQRTLILKHPNRYIPQFMEDLSDIPLVLHMGEQTKTLPIEVASIRSYTLRVKLKMNTDIEGIDLSSVNSATIDAKSPVFLIEELRKQFKELGVEQGYDDKFDMQDNLCENIEFVFGPPGTGKTTYLAQNVLIPMMHNNADCKVLVLTPTNKSADVLVHRIIGCSKGEGYKNWLIRFGATGDEEIEQSEVFKDKTIDIRNFRRNVTVTTIARFPYDYFMPEGSRVFLHGINWDYIVIDEASMIPLVNIIFPLYKKTPQKFIVAGDPFQIEPITSVELWKNENIYTMVHLDSFSNPKTVPYQYKVEFLTTQYRSVPDIGYIFSNFAYDGILEHYRNIESQRPLRLNDKFEIKTLNIIKYPVSKYESIYRCKRLQHSSSYQIYSALFTYEYVCYLSRAISKNNPGQLFKIGIIAPYRAQADMIDKLLASEKLPKEIDVQAGTIHGFQGDECDIIFAVFNTPPSITSSKEMFLNKRNIINVSISRARDYLFIVMPDDNTENITNLHLIKRVEQLSHETNAWCEMLSPDLEEQMFGDSHYLENNAFSTSHQSVNVYGLPEKCYEVRAEETAVDVQIHKAARNTYEDNNSNSQINSYNSVDPIQSSYNESSVLDENSIPEELRDTAIDLPVRGAINGWCFLVPYSGKLKTHTIKKTVGMFVPQVRNDQEKMVSVSVVEDDRIIYISEEMFKLYENGLSEPDGIELRRSFLK